MSPEKSEIFTTKPIFPIDEFASNKAVEWSEQYLSSDVGVNGTLYDLTKTQEHLYSFLISMDSLRTLISSKKPHNIEYFRGSLLMLKAIQNSYFKNSEPALKITKKACDGYFNNLLDIEVNHFEVETLKKNTYILEEDSLDPTNLYGIVKNTLVEPKKISRILSTIYQNTRHNIGELFINEEIFMNIVKENKSKALSRPFLQGLVDIYGVFEQQAWSEVLEQSVSNRTSNQAIYSFEDGFEL